MSLTVRIDTDLRCCFMVETGKIFHRLYNYNIKCWFASSSSFFLFYFTWFWQEFKHRITHSSTLVANNSKDINRSNLFAPFSALIRPIKNWQSVQLLLLEEKLILHKTKQKEKESILKDCNQHVVTSLKNMSKNWRNNEKGKRKEWVK